MDGTGSNPDSDFRAEEWDLIKNLVAECQQQEPADLAAWLKANCVSERVRREVERLIRSASTCGDFLEEPASEKYFGIRRNQPERIGRYRVIEELGSGGIGVVYAASDDELKRRVAIKVLHPHAAADPELRKRLRWDAQAASALQHPNIVVVYEVGSDRELDYVAMECIAGKTLGDLIPSTGMETAEVLRCGIQIARGLEAAHNAGIVHRDLKPGNIMVTDTGVVKLLDFGLAKHTGPGLETSNAPITIEGKFAGTVAYVSPEQAEGKPVDARSDIFSFGLVLFEMLTGRRAFRGDSTISVLADILHTDPPSPCEINPRLDRRFEEIVQRCLKKSRDRRFQTVGEVRVRLEEIQEERAQTEHDRSAVHTRIVHRSNGWLWAAAAICACAALVLGAAWWRVRAQLASSPVLGEFHQLTAVGGLTGYPTISQDGNQVAYASDRFGQGDLDIYVQPTDGTDAVRVTESRSNDSEPDFTPKGDYVVYRSEKAGGGLYLTPSNMPRERPLAPQGRTPRVSPDGKLVLFWKGQLGGGIYPNMVSIWTVPVLSGPPTRVVTGLAAEAYPVWSPKGDRILFLARENAQERREHVDWWVAGRDGKGARRTGAREVLEKAHLRPPWNSYWVVPSAWVPGRNVILFAARQRDSTSIWEVPVDDEGMVTGEPRRMSAGTLIESSPAASVPSQGFRFVYAAQTVTTSVWRVNLDHEGRAAGPAEPLITGYLNVSSPSLSWDGRKLAYQSLENVMQVIHLVDLKSGEQQILLAVRTPQDPRPILSGDGEVLAYSDTDAGLNRTNLYRIAAGVTEQICLDCSAPTSVSFDGREVLFEAAREPEQVYRWNGQKELRPVLRVAGTAPRQYAGRLSPDGRWLLFEGANAGSPDRRIYMAPVRKEGTVAPDEIVELTKGPTDREAAWSPDGQKVYYLSNRDGFGCIWGLKLSSNPVKVLGEPFEVARFHTASRLISAQSSFQGDIGLSVSRDFLVFAVTQSAGNVWEQLFREGGDGKK